MDFWDLVVQIFLVWVVVHFFTKQFLIYRNLKRRGFYDDDSNSRMSVLEQIYHIRRGFIKAKKDFIREQKDDRQSAQ